MGQGQAPRPHCSSGNWSDVCLLSDASSLMMALRVHVIFQEVQLYRRAYCGTCQELRSSMAATCSVTQAALTIAELPEDTAIRRPSCCAHDWICS